VVGEKSIPEGYKETEVGVIPEDWEVKRLGEVAEIKGGKRMPKGRSLTTEETSYPYIKVSDMYYGGVSLEEIEYVPVDVFPSIKNYRIFKEDIFISVAGTLGIVGKIPTDLDGANLTENADRITNITCERDYLFYYLMSSNVQNIIQNERTVAAQPKLALTRIRNFLIVLPKSKSEQKAIAEALSDIDELIAAIEKLIAKKQKIKQGTMQLLLTGKKRLPGFTGEWGKDKIRDLALITTGSRNTQDSVKEGKYPFFVRSSTVERINSYSYDGEAVLTAGDGVGTGKVFHYINGKFDFHQRVYKISDFDERIDGYFFYMFFSQNFLSRIMSMTAKSSVDSVRMKMITEMEIPLPPLPEQRAIAQILSDMDAEIEALEKKLEKYRLIKAGMMEKLLTGEVRLV
jgi:type I restriction enzyme S subunit